MKRKVRYILARVVGALAILVLALCFVLQLPAVQTKLAQRAVTLLDKVCDAEVSMSAVKIYLPGTLVIKDLLVLDKNALIQTDTLIFAETLSASIRLDWLFLGEGIHMARVMLENGGLIIVPEDTPHLANINRVLRFIPPEYPPDAKDGNIFDLRRVDVKNFHFRLINKRDSIRRIPPYGIDFGNLDLTTTIRGHDLHFTDGLMYGTSDHCDIHVKGCDYYVHDVTGNCRVGKGMTLVENIHIIDQWSDLKVKMYSMEYKSPRHLRYMAKRVKIGLIPEGGNLSMQTLKQFTGNFDGNLTDIEFHGGKVDGYLRDLGIQMLDITDRNSGLSGIIDGRIVNVDAADRLGISARLINFTTTSEGLDILLSQWANGKELNLKKFAPGQKIVLNADASGRINNLKASLSIKSPSGSINARATVNNLTDKDNPMRVNGSLATRKLALDKIIQGFPVGDLDMTGRFGVTLGKSGPQIKIDTLNISSIEILKGTFHNINAAAGLNKNNVYLKMASHDPSLDLSLFGSACLGEQRQLKCAGDIRNISMDALGLVGKNNIHSIATKFSANIAEDKSGKLTGDILLPDVALLNDSSLVNTGRIALSACQDGNKQKINLKSELADITYSGDRTPGDFISDLKKISIDKYLPALSMAGTGTDGDGQCGNYSLYVNFHRSPALLDLLVPGAFISDSTKIQLDINRNGFMRGMMASSRLEIGALSARKVDLSFDNIEDGFNAFLTNGELSSGKIKLKKAKLNLLARDNCINAGIKYDNSTGERTEKAFLNLAGMLKRNRKDSLEVVVRPYMSFIDLNDEILALNGEMRFRNGNLKFNDVILGNSEEFVRIDGGWAKRGRDSVRIDISNFSLGFIDTILGLKLGAVGSLSGYADIESPMDAESDINADIKCTGTKLGEINLGELDLAGHWNKPEKKLSVSLLNTIEDQEAISAQLDYSPRGKQIFAHAKFNNMNLAMAKPMLKDVFSDMGGCLNGEIYVKGTKNALKIEEKGMNLQDAMITVALTGVTYFINGDLDLDNRKLSFDRLSIKDDKEGKGSLNGSLSFDKEFKLNADLTMDRIKVLDAPEKLNSPVYGQVETSGNIKILGTKGKFDIDADILANSPGNIHIPLNTALVGSTSDLLTFVERVKYGDHKVDLTIPSKKRTKKMAINASGRLRISRDLVAWAEIDKTTGNKMKVSGDGDVRFNIHSNSGQIKLNGLYSIDEGYYHFVIPGLLEKDFNIGKGSNVTLSGDVKDVALDIKAVHPVRASLATLLADTTARSTRTAVDCIIGISGKASSPKLAFDIEIPDIDPSTKAKVETALNTEDKKQKQFMSLLLFGTFMPAEESGVINGTNMLYSNVGEIMSGQVNSIMQKLDIPVDFGFGYQQSIKGDNMYDVAVSTQLFNNRVLINGSVGSRQSTGSGGTTQSDVVGDIDIAVKLDKKGRWRVSVFSRSANEYTSFIDNSQRSGLGVSYQKEFSTLKELFTTSKRAAALPPEDDNKIIIKVE